MISPLEKAGRRWLFARLEAAFNVVDSPDMRKRMDDVREVDPRVVEVWTGLRMEMTRALEALKEEKGTSP